MSISEGSVALRANNGSFVGVRRLLIANRTAKDDAIASFTLIDLGGGKVALRAHDGALVCAEDAGKHPLVADRSAIGRWETFTLTEPSQGHVALQACNGKYVCAEGGGGRELIADRTELRAWETFELVDLKDGAASEKRVALRANNGSFVGVRRLLIANRTAKDDAIASFTLIDLGGGKVALRAHDGALVCAEDAGKHPLVADRSAIGRWETFTLTEPSQGHVALQACNGKYVCAEGGGGRLLIADRPELRAWETFGLVDLKDGPVSRDGLIIEVSRRPGRTADEKQGDPEDETLGQYVCRVQRKELTASFNEQLLLDPRSDVIWPGALIDGGSIATGGYRPVRAERGPLTFSISAPYVSNPVKRVDHPKLSTIRSAVNDLLHECTPPKTIAYQIEGYYFVHSDNQLDISLGCHYKNKLFSMKGAFDFSDQSVENKLVAKVVQRYYTLDVDHPNDPQEFFALPQPTINPDHLFVSSVTYGRMLLFTFESTMDETDLKATAEFAITAAKKEGGVELSAKREKQIQSTKIQLMVMGGAADAGFKILKDVDPVDSDQSESIRKMFSGMQEYLNEGANFGKDSPAAPLAYKLRYLNDGSIANITMMTQYNERQCRKSTNEFKVTVKEIRRYEHDSKHGEKTQEWFGSIWVEYFVPNENPVKVVVWKKKQKNYETIGRKGSIQIDEVVSFSVRDFDNKATKDVAYVEVGGDIEDKGWGDQVFENDPKKVWLRDVFPGAAIDAESKFHRKYTYAKLKFTVEAM